MHCPFLKSCHHISTSAMDLFLSPELELEEAHTMKNSSLYTILEIWKERLLSFHSPFTVQELVTRQGGTYQRNIDNIDINSSESLKELQNGIIRRVRHNPRELLKKDQYDNLPLHAALSCEYINLNTVKEFIRLQPETILTCGRFSRTPLHCVLVRAKSPCHAIRLILRYAPDLASKRTKGGWLPIHYATDSDTSSLEAVKLLQDAYQLGVQTLDFEDKLPLHWCVDRPQLNVDLCKYLIQKYPQGVLQTAKVQDRYNESLYHLWSPLEKMILIGSKEHILVARYSMHLFKYTINDFDQILRRNLNWNARKDIVMTMHYTTYYDEWEENYISDEEFNQNDLYLAAKLYYLKKDDLWRYVISFL